MFPPRSSSQYQLHISSFRISALLPSLFCPIFIPRRYLVIHTTLMSFYFFMFLELFVSSVLFAHAPPCFFVLHFSLFMLLLVYPSRIFKVFFLTSSNADILPFYSFFFLSSQHTLNTSSSVLLLLFPKIVLLLLQLPPLFCSLSFFV